MSCENLICQSDNPLDGVSIETTEAPGYTGISYRKPRQPLGSAWGAFGTVQYATSEVSQFQADADADTFADAAAGAPVAATPSAIQQTCSFFPRDPIQIGEAEHKIGRQPGCITEPTPCPEPILGESTGPPGDEEFLLGEGGEYIVGE